MKELTPRLDSLISLLPDSPGVYLMKDGEGKIIYIGKAKSLKKRVSQYFLRPQSGKVKAMVDRVEEFSTILVKSDKEAFILEMNLIQTHHPRYNIMLMDDSHYPYIALKKHGDPYLKIARSSKDPSFFYFGPFPNSGYCYRVIDLLNKLYPLRKCKAMPSKSCLYASMGLCLAPCVNKIDASLLESLYEQIKSFFSLGNDEVEKRLKEKIEEASEKMDYERALEYKKALDSLRYVKDKQAVEISADKKDRDVVSYCARDGYLCLSLLSYRNGMLLGKNSYVVESFSTPEEQSISLLELYYSTREPPKELVSRIKGLEELEEELPLKVIAPKEGRLLDMLSLAELNAKSALDAHFCSSRLEEDKAALLDELARILGLKGAPLRIELFDNSHLQGSSAVGAMVCFINGEPSKKNYRKFRLSEEDAGDDYHSMKEVVGRRYKRLKEENSSFPDLILTDGGLTQVHASLEGLDEAGVQVPVYGLYKNDKHQTEGLIDKDGKKYPLDKKSSLFFLLMRMQDEVHRFAISYHKQVRGKNMTKSLFDGIEGLGPKRIELLHAHYPSIDSLLSSSVTELGQLIPLSSAEALYKKLHDGE